MTEAEKFWYDIVCEMADGQEPDIADTNQLLGETPDWVTKLSLEVIEMVMPRVQLRVGQAATPNNVGVTLGSHFALCHQLSERVASMTRRGESHPAAVKTIERAVQPFRPADVVGLIPELVAWLRPQIGRVTEKVLTRPLPEISTFFRAVGRGLQNPKSCTLLWMDDDPATLTTGQRKRLRTITVYWITLMNWQAIERLTSSKEAYDFLVKLLPVEIIGHDPERIRRMFSRLGKRFKEPGRPPKR
jgi:hypothetical protein